jgi:hypothetical protein
MWWWYYRGPNYQTMATLLRSRITYFLMLGLGLLLAFWFVMEDGDLRAASSTFRKTPCVVEDSDIEVHSRDRWGMPRSFSPVVTFTFTAADGKERTVTGYRLHEDGMPMDAAATIADRYEPGEQTWCYYDPADPERAVLSLDTERHTLGWLVFLSVLLLGGGVTGLVVLHFADKASRPLAAPPPDLLAEALRPLKPAAPADGLQAAPPGQQREGVHGRA